MIFKLNLVNCFQVFLIVSCIQETCFAHGIQKREDGDCPPIELENGKFNILGKNHTAGYPIPKYSIVKFTCNDNYALYPANSLVSCVDGVWNIPVPQCKPTCPARLSSSVDVTCSLEGKAVNCSQPLVEGTEVVSKCKQFYTPTHNDTSTSRCSNASWDNDLVKCELECGEVASDGATLIVNGQNAKKGEFPWHVGIYRLQEQKHNYLCGGSIISQLIVLIAAHCFTDVFAATQNPAEEYYVGAGKYYSDYNSEADVYAQKRQIKEYHIPPQYRGLNSNFAGDLAVAILKQPFEMTNLVRPVCVDWYNEFESEQLKDNNVGSVVGWGYSDLHNPQISDELQQLNAPFINLTECLRSVPVDFRRWISPEKFCVGFTNGSSVCQGDTGGGLVFAKEINNKQKFYIRGIVSVGLVRDDGICDNFQYGVYTKISYYRDFILNVRKRNQMRNDFCPPVTIENGKYEVFDRYYKQGSSIPNNAFVQFACNSSYTLYPKDNSFLTCVDGFWNGPVPQCKLEENIELSPCPPISIETGQIFVSGQRYTPGTPVPAYAVVEFTCSANYSLYPANPVVTCINGKWNTDIPQCKLTCPPLNGSTVDVTCTLDEDPVDCSQPMVEGTLAVSKCKPFYTTTYFEIPVSTCTGRTWDNPLVRCAPDCGELVPDGVTNIISGQTATKGEFPWHIALYRLQEDKHEYQCGGSIISQLIVLTAAHCFTDAFGTTRYPAQEFYVGAGKYFSDYNSEADVYVQKRHVKEYHIPAEFRGHETSYAGDLAVVVVENPFEMTNLVQPVCMDWFSQFESKQLVPSNTGRVVGWGFVDPNIQEASEILKLLDAPYINKTKCINEFPPNFRRWVTTDKFCAGVRNGSSVCKGDSGGGLVFQWHTQKFYLRGLVSVGPKEKGIQGTCFALSTVLYTRVATCPARLSSSVDVSCTLEGKAVNCNQHQLEDTVAVSKCKQFYTPTNSVSLTSKCSNGTWDNDLPKCEIECGEVSPEDQPLIVNAQNTKIGQFPWHVGLYRFDRGNYQYLCGGSIISPIIFITGAICLTERSDNNTLENFYVAAGKYYNEYDSTRDKFAQKRKIKEYHVPPQYRGVNSYYVGDLAVVIVDESFEMTNLVRPVCVDWYNQYESEQLRDDNIGSVVGWGFKDPNNSEISSELQQLNAPFVNLAECSRSVPETFRSWITPQKFCAGLTNGSSVCNGESGGGLVFARKINNKQKFYIRGIASVGPSQNGVCGNFRYGVYTKISYYKNFILRVLQKNQIREDSCPPVTIENGEYTVFDINYSQGAPVPNYASVLFTCNADYTLHPKENSLVNCVDGSWDRSIPKCRMQENVKQSTCPPLSSIEQGQIYVSGQRYTPGTPVPAYAVVEFTCNANYSLYPANPLVNCVNGKWNTAIPQCKMTCPPLKGSTVDVTCTLDGDPVDCSQPMVEGTLAVSKCKPFYTTTYFEIPVSTCTGRTWDNPLVRCAPDCGELVSDGVTNIINGQNVTKGEFPWHIAVYRLQEEKHEYQCGGSIISPLIVLTAAHCFTDEFGTTRYPAQEFYIGAGKYFSDYNSEADVYVQKRHVKEYHIPAEFTGHETNYGGDLAVVVVENPLKMTNLVQPVCMDWFNQFEAKQLVPSNIGRVVGWGFVDPNIPEASETLKQLDAPYINKTKCIKEFPSNFRRWVTTDKFCAGVRTGSSVCKGDSGGGLVFQWHTQKFYLRGLVSVGPKEKGTCDNFQYGVYTRISNYMDFILNIRRLNQVID